MKTKKITVLIASVLIAATMLISCHRQTCPTYGQKAIDRAELRV
ncbi:MAG: hypothetical protein R2772_03280 [Chitinophagales bacterium]